jgi:TolB-like protein/Tfp pilus assembly protein PilF
VKRVDGSDGAGDRLDSWKEIAAYLKRGARTVQRWEREEGLPVHRLVHDKLGSVYAYHRELDAWWRSREAELANEPPLPAEAAPSVAVLPFADMSQEKDQAYFCEGMAEEILDVLGKIQGLRVSSRTASFRSRTPDADTREIGRRLRVGTLLEGSLRKSGDQLRIVVQLTDAESGFQLWSGRYDREMSDIFAVQREIAENVVRALEVTLSRNERTALGKPRTADVRAYDCYLRGRKFYYQYSPQAVEFALQMFVHAMELDPSYPQAYAGLADCWSYLYLYSGRSEAVREQADWASLQAVEMDPRSAHAWASRGLSLSLSGKNEEAGKAFDLAVRLAPDLFEAYYFHARHCFAMGRFEQAAKLYEESMRVNPDDYQSPLLVAQIYDDLGRPAEAVMARQRGIEVAERHLRLNPDDARAFYMAANALVAFGKRPQGQQWAERALAIRPDDPMLLYNVGCIFSLLGRVEPAIECLEKAARNGLSHKGWFEHDSNLDPLRKHPRFQELVGNLC